MGFESDDRCGLEDTSRYDSCLAVVELLLEGEILFFKYPTAPELCRFNDLLFLLSERVDLVSEPTSIFPLFRHISLDPVVRLEALLLSRGLPDVAGVACALGRGLMTLETRFWIMRFMEVSCGSLI